MSDKKAPDENDATSSRGAASTTVEYLDDLLKSMTAMARGSGHGMLAYLIAMAALEAARLARKS